MIKMQTCKIEETIKAENLSELLFHFEMIPNTAKMQIFLNVVFVLFFSNLAVLSAVSDEYTLEQLQVLFRHGDRMPNQPEVFPTDPHDDIYRSYGYGQLTKIGKEREYKIGQILRKRYDTFLGEYKNNEVYAYSSDLDRTKMSLQLVLADLYPPTPSNSWSKSIDWQPIPTHYDASDAGFLTAAFDCPSYTKLHRDVAKTPEVSSLMQKYEDLFHRVERKTGITISWPFTAWPIYNSLRSTLSLGLPLAANFTLEDFHELEEVTSVAMKALSYTELMRRMLTGPMVERILKVLHEKESAKKLYLYGGHEFNVAAFIDSHNITGAPSIQDYGSTLILEKLRGRDNRTYIRLYLWTGVTEKLIPLKFDKCEKTCPLSDYEKIVQTILPNQASRICISSSTFCRRRMESGEEIDLDDRISYFFAGSDLASFKYMKDFSPYSVERS